MIRMNPLLHLQIPGRERPIKYNAAIIGERRQSAVMDAENVLQSLYGFIESTKIEFTQHLSPFIISLNIGVMYGL